MSESNKIRILVVEDEHLVRESLIESFQSMGYEVAGQASNGDEAIRLAQSQNPDLIFMDIKMPEMDGIEAARRIQEFREIPVVLITAYESENLIQKASDAGVVSYLMKPPTVTEIHRNVTIAMARHQDRMKLKQLNRELTERTQALESALREVHVLRGILPICANCKKIRNDDGYWEKVESYLEKHSDVSFTHGFCPDCEQTLYKDFLHKDSGKPLKKKKKPTLDDMGNSQLQ